MPRESETPIPEITVAEFVSTSSTELALDVAAGKGSLSRKSITSERIQKLGLALAGFTEYLRHGRVKIVGKSEISYLSNIESHEYRDILNRLDPQIIPCIIVTKGLQIPVPLIEYAEANSIPLLRTEVISSRAISLITTFLQERLAPQVTMHGVLLGIYGTGVLLIGESGIGKSECALDLITRGHRLISDDSVVVRRIASRLVGDSPEITRGHLEIRGLGIISVSDLFGVSAVGQKAPIELCIELKAWDKVQNVERLGVEMQKTDVFGVAVDSFVFPVSPARNLSTLVETAVKLFLLKRSGFDAAQQLIEKHAASVAGNNRP
jgi:HPr kinase/phosphorylase